MFQGLLAGIVDKLIIAITTSHDQAIRKIGQLRLVEASLIMIIPVPHLIYRISCTQCNILYIGETSRQIHNRFGEHKCNVRNKTHLNEQHENDPKSIVSRHSLFLASFLHQVKVPKKDFGEAYNFQTWNYLSCRT